MSFSIRLECGAEDRVYIEGLNPRLTDVIIAPTHSVAEVAQFQSAFTCTAWDTHREKNATFLAVADSGERLGYVNVREGHDEILSEPCGYIALLAVVHGHEGRGIAKALVEQAEQWAQDMGYSRLALDVFASNDHALGFYERAGFLPETVRVIKRL